MDGTTIVKRINNFENGLDFDSRTWTDFIKKSTIEIKTPALDEIKNISEAQSTKIAILTHCAIEIDSNWNNNNAIAIVTSMEK